MKLSVFALGMRLYVGVFCSFSMGAVGAFAQGDTFVMGALGDSITTGFNSRGIGDHRTLSWSTGSSTEVMSHFRRLQSLTNRPITAYNLARTGAKADELLGQLAELESNNPSYVTVAIGANDVCSWGVEYGEQLELFERDVRVVISQMIERNPQIHIVLSPIPDMYNLWEVAHVHSGCQTRWNFLGICPSLLGRSRTELDRQAFAGRWRAANDALSQLADEFADNVKFNPQMAETRFEWGHVSTTDCFHPSVAGQNLFSEKTWEPDWVASNL